MAATIGTLSIAALEKAVKSGAAKGFVAVNGSTAKMFGGGTPNMVAIPSGKPRPFVVVVVEGGDARLAGRASDPGAAKQAAMRAAMKNAKATIYTAQLVGTSGPNQVYKLAHSFRRA